MQIAAVRAHSLDAVEYSKRWLLSHAFTEDQSEPEDFPSRRVYFREETSWYSRNPSPSSSVQSGPLASRRLAGRGSEAQVCL